MIDGLFLYNLYIITMECFRMFYGVKQFGTGTVLTQAVEWQLAVAKCCGNSSVTIFPTCGES
jgi:hypothetical protein